MNDRRLTRCFLRYRDRGEGPALAQVFDHLAPELLDVARHLVRDRAEAEDLVQNTFLVAMSRAESFRAGQSLRPWLFGILWREGARARRRAARSFQPSDLHAGSTVEGDPARRMEARELPQAVQSALAELPPHYRDVLEPFLVEGATSEDIAHALERPAGTVRSQIHRGLNKLRRKLPTGFFSVAAASQLPSRPVRGLAAVRAQVLHQLPETAAVQGASSAALTTLGTTASLTMTKALLAPLGIASLLGLGGVALWQQSPHETPSLEAASFAKAPPAVIANLRSQGSDRSSASDSPTLNAASTTPEPTHPPVREGTDLETWLAAFAEDPDNWRHGWAVAQRIAQLPPEQGLAIMRGVWPHLSEPVRAQVLKPFVFHGGHPKALGVLDLAAHDDSPDVRRRAFGYLEKYALRDFSADPAAYEEWFQRWGASSVGEVLEQNLRGLSNELSLLTLNERLQRLEDADLDDRTARAAGLDMSELLRAGGALQLLSNDLGQANPEQRRELLQFAQHVRPDEAWLRQWVLPDVQQPGDQLVGEHFVLLGQSGHSWAREPMVTYLASQAGNVELDLGLAYTASSAVAELGDPAAIPDLIAALEEHSSEEYLYAIGYYALSPLTGVKWKESHDAAFWKNWWQTQGSR